MEGAETHCRVVKALCDGVQRLPPPLHVPGGAGHRARHQGSEELLKQGERLPRPEAGGSRMAETAFSTFKRLFGEHVRARSLPNMIREMLLKARLYNFFTSLNPAPCAVNA